MAVDVVADALGLFGRYCIDSIDVSIFLGSDWHYASIGVDGVG